MTRCITISFLLFLTSCASNYMPESFAEKLARLEVNSTNTNRVPNFSLSKSHSPQAVKRSIASANNKTSTKYSNRTLYFLTLLDQYQTLGAYSQQDVAQIRHCPSFHTFYYNKEKTVHPKQSVNFEKVVSQSDYENRPIYNLPLSREEKYPTVKDVIIRKDLTKEEKVSTVKKGIEIHISKIHRELSELCEHGNSINYYIFENLVAHRQAGEIDKGHDGMNILLKTTLVSNMALIKSLQRSSSSRSPASSIGANSFESATLDRLKADWASGYIQSIR